jgi:DNA-binding IscR family transcriptional regulator
MTCVVRLTMIEVRDAIAAVLDSRSIAALAAEPELRATA